ncbi:MAG: GPW/gp25 family protein [Phaeodactylibacter sp.]|nr:GPW/gp25 family protein [Phaeodactylibacter sp.]
MNNKDTSFLGRGWSFPPEFAEGGRDVAMAAGPDDVQQSLEILFGTRLQERILREDYGSGLHDFVFGEINVGILNQLRNTIAEAVLYHEPRVELNSVGVDVDEQTDGLLLITLDYTIPASNTRFNMVYPFYLKEAGI